MLRREASRIATNHCVKHLITPCYRSWYRQSDNFIRRTVTPSMRNTRAGSEKFHLELLSSAPMKMGPRNAELNVLKRAVTLHNSDYSNLMGSTKGCVWNPLRNTNFGTIVPHEFTSSIVRLYSNKHWLNSGTSVTVVITAQ